MDVPTKHGVHVIVFCVMSDSGFEPADETHGVFHSSFCIRAERPEAETETAPDEVDEWIERKERSVAKVPRNASHFTFWTTALSPWPRKSGRARPKRSCELRAL